MAEAGPLDELQRARAELLRAQVRVRRRPRPRRPAPVARGRQATRAARRQALARDLPGRVLRGALRGPPRAGRRRAGGCRGRLAANWGAADADSPRACDLLLDGVAVLTTQGYAARRAGPEARARGIPRRADVGGGRAALALARVPRRAGSGRRRELGRADRSTGAARARGRCALAAPDRAHGALRRATVPRRPGRGAVAGRGGGSRRRGHGQPSRAAGRHRPRRVAWLGGARSPR